MPLASLFSLQWYGPATGAMVDAAGSGALVSATPKGRARLAVADGGSGGPVFMRAIRLKHSPIFVEGVGSLLSATPKGRSRPTMVVNIGAVPSAFDIAQTVLNSISASYNIPGTIGEKINDAGSASNPWTEVIESGYTAAEVLRLIASAAVGLASGGPGSPVFRDLGDTKNRIVGTADGDGNRTAVTYDAT